MLGRFSVPTVRVFVDREDGLPLDASNLRAIDEHDPAATIPPVEPRLQRDILGGAEEKLFSPPRGSEWIHEKPLNRPETSFFSVGQGDGVPVQPVRGLSIPNPLNLLSNPFRWGGRFRAEYGTNFDDLDLLRGNLIVNSGIPIGFDTEFNYRSDDARGHSPDDFWTGDFNIIYRFGQIRYAEIRAGIGVNWLAETGNTDFGYNATYGVDFHLAKPWIISTSFDWGTLGSDSLLHMRVTGGIDLGRFELYVGYDFFELDDREYKAIVAGIGMWF